MRTSKTLALLAAALAGGIALGAGTAQADQKHAPVQASAPKPVAEVLRTGGGTVVGSVTEVGATWLTVRDESGETNVAARDFLPEGIRPGDPITVVGRAKHGGMKASEIILADGTSHGAATRTARDAQRDSDDD
ncbi:cytochrome c maturation protein CcmE [Azospirillum sp. sgz302134]